MTCALPVLVTPVFIDDKCFIDGGVACNYPLCFCVDSGKLANEILGFKNSYENENNSKIGENSTLLDYLLFFYDRTRTIIVYLIIITIRKKSILINGSKVIIITNFVA